MVNLTRIYTRTGDDGTTGLGDFSRVPKDDVRLAAFADVDELNSVLGIVLTLPDADLPADVRATLLEVQNDLFDVGADLCTPLPPADQPPAYPQLRVTAPYITWLESQCDRYNVEVPALRSFILPGGGAAAAHLHLARTVARRAERQAWSAHRAYPEQVSTAPIQYLNRLSDLLFILARVANRRAGTPEPEWRSGLRQLAEPTGN